MKQNKYIIIFFIITTMIAWLFAAGFTWKLDKVNAKLMITEDELMRVKIEFNKDKEKHLAEIENIRTRLLEAETTIADLKSTEYELIYLGDYKLTHYCTEKRPHICGTGTGLTATGTQVAADRTIAVDPRVIPYGTEVYIEGYGWRVAEDCGGAVNGRHIDIAVDTHKNALDLGTIYGGVWILVKKGS